MFGCGNNYGGCNNGFGGNSCVILLIIAIFYYQGLLNTRNCKDNSSRNALVLLFLFWLCCGCGNNNHSNNNQYMNNNPYMGYNPYIGYNPARQSMRYVPACCVEVKKSKCKPCCCCCK